MTFNHFKLSIFDNWRYSNSAHIQFLIEINYFFVNNYFLGRRARAAVKSAPMATTLGAIQQIVDQNFASPKRKDCKLDTNSLSPLTKERLAKLPSNQAATAQINNSKRNQKNGAGAKPKNKASPSITKFFPINGRNSFDNNASENASKLNDSITLICDSPVLQKDDNKFVKPDDSAKTTMNETKPKNENKLNDSILLSPEVKSIQQSQIKQTTPHRIVCHQSVSKKQRLYVKDPVEVFSNLNIRDGSSPKIKSGNRTRKNQQKTRRNLNVNEVDNSENEKFTTNSLDVAAAVPIVNGDASKPLVNGTIDRNANKKSSNMGYIAPKNSTASRTTQMTDFYPIRRSVRKTKQVVEQEQTRFIEIAIEKQLEDGLIVKDFGEKGRGIVAGRLFQRGEFVVEYIGELIDQAEADRREDEYAKKTDFGCYMYYFKHKEQQWW